MEPQILESIEADFGKLTWTFGLGQSNHVAAGQFAILPADDFKAAMDRLTRAEHLLRRLCDTQSEDTMGQQCYEACLRFFDPPF